MEFFIGFARNINGERFLYERIEIISNKTILFLFYRYKKQQYYV